ncbi:hypothetical protein [Streptomyces sp900116325]|uniref:hypothetical protein n=1 Tax=Streptomyces sp. 900116325 TaxID=3154295 RepID=UPI00331797CB
MNPSITTTVDTADLLMVTAAMLREHPRQILTETQLVKTVLRAAGDSISTSELRPVWEALPLGPDGDEHAEYAARLVLTANGIRTDDRASVRTGICRDEIARLSAKDARTMTPADFDRLAQAQAELAQLSER